VSRVSVPFPEALLRYRERPNTGLAEKSPLPYRRLVICNFNLTFKYYISHDMIANTNFIVGLQVKSWGPILCSTALFDSVGPQVVSSPEVHFQFLCCFLFFIPGSRMYIHLGHAYNQRKLNLGHNGYN
jgi:hypothetical protein